MQSGIEFCEKHIRWSFIVAGAAIALTATFSHRNGYRRHHRRPSDAAGVLTSERSRREDPLLGCLGLPAEASPREPQSCHVFTSVSAMCGA